MNNPRKVRDILYGSYEVHRLKPYYLANYWVGVGSILLQGSLIWATYSGYIPAWLLVILFILLAIAVFNLALHFMEKLLDRHNNELKKNKLSNTYHLALEFIRPLSFLLVITIILLISFTATVGIQLDWSAWYSYVIIIIVLATALVTIPTSTFLCFEVPIHSLPDRYTVILETIDRGEVKSAVDVTARHPGVLQVRFPTLATLNLDQEDINDIQIIRIESDHRAIVSRIDSYLLESVLLGALAFSGFLTIVSSDALGGSQPFAINELVDVSRSARTFLAKLTDITSTQVLGSRQVFQVVLLESLICSVCFTLVLTQRLRFSDLSLKMDYLIRTLQIFNSKEEELVLIDLQQGVSLATESKQVLQQRKDRLQHKMLVALSDARSLLQQLSPVVQLISLLRHLGLFTFYLILATSGLYFSAGVFWGIILLAVFSELFRWMHRRLKAATIGRLLQRH